MKTLLTFLVILISAGFVLADPGAIAGAVVEARTGNPVAHALVVAKGPHGIAGRAVTDARGHYEIGRLAPGMYRVGAEARGYKPEVYPGPVVVRSGEVTRGIIVHLVPKPRTGAIAGRLINARSREPIAGAVIIAEGENGRGRATTDRHGNYKIGGLNPGFYRVTAVARGYQPEAFPRPVPVRPGEATTGIDFALRPIHGAGD